MNTLDLKYFEGTSDDLGKLEGQVHKWLKAQGAASVQLNSAVHFDESEKLWHILVTALYQKKSPSSGLAVPRLVGLPSNPGRN